MTRWNQGNPAPFFWEGGRIGALLIHGFTGSAAEMRLLGRYLHGRGLSVAAPLLPGHGTTPADLNRCDWQAWLTHAEQALLILKRRCPIVFVAGLSMGALLALNLAARHPDLVGAVLYAPALQPKDWRIHLTPVLKHIIRQLPVQEDPFFCDPGAMDWFWAYDVTPVAAAHQLLKLIHHTQPLLPKVGCPLLVVQSLADHEVDPHSAHTVCAQVSSEQADLLFLDRSNHCVTIDCEWEAVAERTYRFVLAHALKADGIRGGHQGAPASGS